MNNLHCFLKMYYSIKSFDKEVVKTKVANTLKCVVHLPSFITPCMKMHSVNIFTSLRSSGLVDKGVVILPRSHISVVHTYITGCLKLRLWYITLICWGTPQKFLVSLVKLWHEQSSASFPDLWRQVSLTHAQDGMYWILHGDWVKAPEERAKTAGFIT